MVQTQLDGEKSPQNIVMNANELQFGFMDGDFVQGFLNAKHSWEGYVTGIRHTKQGLKYVIKQEVVLKLHRSGKVKSRAPPSIGKAFLLMDPMVLATQNNGARVRHTKQWGGANTRWMRDYLATHNMMYHPFYNEESLCTDGIAASAKIGHQQASQKREEEERNPHQIRVVRSSLHGLNDSWYVRSSLHGLHIRRRAVEDQIRETMEAHRKIQERIRAEDKVRREAQAAREQERLEAEKARLEQQRLVDEQNKQLMQQLAERKKRKAERKKRREEERKRREQEEAARLKREEEERKQREEEERQKREEEDRKRREEEARKQERKKREEEERIRIAKEEEAERKRAEEAALNLAKTMEENQRIQAELAAMSSSLSSSDQ